MIKISKLLPAAFCFLLTLAACNTSRVYEENSDFPDRVWTVENRPSFEFTIPDSTKTYNLLINVRNDLEYPYRNLYVQYTLKDSLQNTLERKLKNLMLFHPKTGKPYGDGLGDIFSHQLLLEENISFETKGPYTIQLEQFMRTDSLTNILSSGIRIEKAKLAASE
jgi:gliding motility-associated lipoprotein GldH